MSELHAALKEHKKKEAEMKQELNECRVELLASCREVKALLVQTIDLPNDREKELENKFMVLTNELETARLSCQLFQQRGSMLQEKISKLTLDCDEDDQGAPENQNNLALEREEQIAENADCCKRTIVNNEETIKSIEMLIRTPANQLVCMQTDSEPDHHPPETAPSLESDDSQEKMHSLSCSTSLCITNIMFH